MNTLTLQHIEYVYGINYAKVNQFIEFHVKNNIKKLLTKDSKQETWPMQLKLTFVRENEHTDTPTH